MGGWKRGAFVAQVGEVELLGEGDRGLGNLHSVGVGSVEDSSDAVIDDELGEAVGGEGTNVNGEVGMGRVERSRRFSRHGDQARQGLPLCGSYLLAAIVECPHNLGTFLGTANQPNPLTTLSQTVHIKPCI